MVTTQNRSKPRRKKIKRSKRKKKEQKKEDAGEGEEWCKTLVLGRTETVENPDRLIDIPKSRKPAGGAMLVKTKIWRGYREDGRKRRRALGGEVGGASLE